MMRTRFLAVLGSLASLLLASGARAQDSERWYELLLEGARSGWTHETRATSGDLITSVTETSLTIRRGETAVEISTRTEFIETSAGKPVEMSARQTLGSTPTFTRYVFRENDVLVITGPEGATKESTEALPAGEWLPPAAASAYLRQRLASGAERVVVRVLDPGTGLQVMQVTRTGFEPAEIEVLGETVRATKCASRISGAAVPIASTEYLDAAGTVLRSETDLGGLRMTMIASTREIATQAADPAELMVSTFVKPARAIAGPRSRTLGRFVLRVPGGELPELPSSAYQSAEVIDSESARVVVDMSAGHAAPGVDRDEHLASTTYADGDDPVIRELAAEGLEGVGNDPRDRAEALRRLVYRHIRSKDLGTAFATASETARTREGDCSEHGVLLAALLRAAGIPSRVAAGVVYVERFGDARNVFGYHMWTQALIEIGDVEAWIDLDPTLNDTTPFDATHIAFAVSSLKDGEAMSALSGMSAMLGVAEIEVEEIK